MNIGILGGTFDPIHLGHLIIAEETRVKLKLDKVLFIPTGQPWLKADRIISPSVHRVKMVRLAIAGNSYFKLSTIEIERPGISYTVDTVSELYKSLSRETQLFLILGWDCLIEFPMWKEPQKLIKMCHLVAVPRPNYNPPDLASLEMVIPGISQNLISLDMTLIGISSSEIRKRVAQGLSIRYLVTDEVLKYIRQHKLYLS